MQRNDVAGVHENEAKILDFSRLRNQIRMRSLVPQKRNNNTKSISIPFLIDVCISFPWTILLFPSTS